MSSNLDRCKFTSADSGTGTSITVGARYSNAFFTPAQAGAVDGRKYTYVIQQGNDIEIQQDQVYTSSTTSFARGTPALSSIGGTVGTTKITLDTTQVISVGASARDMVAPLLAEVRTVTGTTDTLVDGDGFGQVTYNSASAVAVSLAQAGALTFRKGWSAFVRNINTGEATITPTTSTINGATTLVLSNGDSALILSDGTNYTAIVWSTGAVQYDRTTSLTSAQKQTARSNIGVISRPQGRLTLATGVQVMTTTQSAKTTIYYTPFEGTQIPIYDGSNFSMTEFSEISVATTDTTKNPAAMTTNSLYDMFVWNDAGTLRLSHGPAWTNDSTRSAGTALVKVGGLLLNNATITNGPAASRGTYVGTVRSNGSSQIDFVFGGAASGGTAAVLGVWNAYNRRLVSTVVNDNGAGYTYLSATPRQARASTGNQISFVVGLQEDSFTAQYSTDGYTAAATGASCLFGIGYDTTTAFSSKRVAAYAPTPNSYIAVSTAVLCKCPTEGWHYVSANEASDGTNNNTFNVANEADLSLQYWM